MGFYLKAKYGLNKTWDKSKKFGLILEDQTVERERGERKGENKRKKRKKKEKERKLKAKVCIHLRIKCVLIS